MSEYPIIVVIAMRFNGPDRERRHVEDEVVRQSGGANNLYRTVQEDFTRKIAKNELPK